MTRSACASVTVNASSPSPAAIVCEETAPASGHPAQPPVLRSSFALADTFTIDVQLTGSAVSPAAGGGAGVGDGVVVAGASGAGADDVAPVAFGMRTRNASRRPVPAF